MSQTGVSASLVIAAAGVGASSSSQEADLAVDAAGDALAVDADGDVLIVTPAVIWTGTSASETL